MSDYDTYLANCVEDYMNPRVCELYVHGRSLYDLVVETEDGIEKTLHNVPMNYWKDIDLSDYKFCPRWDDICDTFEEDYFDLTELEHFEFDEVQSEEETYLPDEYKIIKIIGFSDGHNFDDLEIDQ